MQMKEYSNIACWSLSIASVWNLGNLSRRIKFEFIKREFIDLRNHAEDYHVIRIENDYSETTPMILIYIEGHS